MSPKSYLYNFLFNSVFVFFFYFPLFLTESRVIIVDNSARAGYNASTCSNNLLCPNLQSAFQNAKSTDRIEIRNGTYTGSKNKNICSTGCKSIFDLTLVGTSSNCDDVEILQTSNSTSDRAIYVTNSTFREISCVKISNFVYLDGNSQVELGLNGGNFGKYEIHSNGGAALLVINASNFMISNVSFYNNRAIAGGAVSILGSEVTINNSTFSDNNAGEVGGAIASFLSHLNVVSSTFTSNSATSTQSGIGGVIYFDGSVGKVFELFQALEIRSSQFDNNFADRGGGALYAASFSSRNNTLVVESTEFRNNSVFGQSSCLSLISCNPRGGAIYANVLSASIKQSKFYLNKAKSKSQEYVAEGGAVYSGNLVVDDSQTTRTYFEDCEFISNSAMGMGGAIYLINQPLVLKASKFINNIVNSLSEYFSDSAPMGGAIWYSSSVPSIGLISNCNFSNNQAQSGWGGAIYGVNSQYPLTITHSQFTSNKAFSSYTNRGRGGAIMVSQPFTLKLYDCSFLENFALPHANYPLTFSGYGGALLGQSVSMFIENCKFEKNLALTGQFDAGSGGGAISLQNCNPVSIKGTLFSGNGAVGLLTTSSFSQPGAGGALFSKFSVVNITDNCVFEYNWASAGGAAPSVGGAIAFYFNQNSVDKDVSSLTGLVVSAVSFNSNYALKQLCVKNSKESGEGGAIYFQGVQNPDARFRNVRFYFNIAIGVNSQLTSVSSFGGALSISEGSNVSCTNCAFYGNAAVFGVGNDVISYSQDNTVSNFVTFKNSSFYNVSAALMTQLRETTSIFATELCFRVKNITSAIETAESIAGLVRRRTAMLESDPSSLVRPTLLRRSLPIDPNNPDRMTNPSSGRYRKLLDLGFQKLNISGVNILYPGVAIVNGYAFFLAPTFIGFYHVFFGDVVSILSGTSFPASSRSSVSLIYGKFQTNLALTIIEANVFLVAILKKMTIGQLSLFNGTLFISNNIIISGDSYLYNASIIGAGSNMVHSVLQNLTNINYTVRPYVAIPTIRFVSTVIAGLSLESILSSSSSSSIVSKIPTSNKLLGNRNISFISSLTFDSCTFVIAKELIVRSTTRHSSSNDLAFASKSALATTFLVVLKNKAVVNITTGAVMSLSADTCYYAINTTSSGIINAGSIDLLGATYTFAASSNEDDATVVTKSNQQININSLTSKLVVHGNFQQTPVGSIVIYLNTTFQTVPVVALTSNKTLSGSISIQFFESTSAELILYNSLPSKWALINFLKLEPPPVQIALGTTYPVAIKAPAGLSVSNSFQAVKSSSSSLIKSNGSLVTYTSSVQLTSIGCSQVNAYYDGYPSASLPYKCYICLSNSSCNMCGEGTCSLSGTCSASSGTAYTQGTYCCSGGCGANGVCTASNNYHTFECVCDVFYTGNNCQLLSTVSIVLIVIGGFIIVALAVSKILFDKYRKQEAQVLDEIRNNILNVNTSTSHSKLSKNSDYIQHMQQALILNDVFVKYEEIKLEEQIGEGSFGVVYKATFRGAQVAVKKMKSMFVELSEKEMDEFKKEAYVMSRLRHPNIVLVMGISLVDVEVMPLVKKYHQSIDDSMRSSLATTPINKQKPKGQKTVCIITEYLGQGSLADILYGENCLPPEVWTYELILTCALQAAKGMLYLHTHRPPICHRDLKTSNLVVDENWVVKVTDFGMSRIVPDKEVKSADKDIALSAMDISAYDESSSARDSFSSQHNFSEMPKNVPGSRPVSESNSGSAPASAFLNPEMTSNLGTTAWCAPELFTTENTTRYSVKVDVYSFGMVMWELWEKKRPFDEFHSRFDIMDAVKAGRRPHIGESCPPTYRAMIQRCWRTSPAQRPKFTTIVRYLKDELSHVRRNRGASTGIAPKTFLRSISLTSPEIESTDPRRRTLSSQIFSSKGNADPSAESKQGDSVFDSTVAMIFDNGRSSINWGSSQLNEMWKSSRRPSVSSHRPSTSSAAGGEASFSSSEQAAAAGKDRSSLVAALNRSLTLLAESPSANNDEKFGRKRYTDPTIERSLSPQTQPPKNSWRENYVMRFSGWRADNPDQGLPPRPSLSTPQPQGSASRTVISPLAPRLSGAEGHGDNRVGEFGGGGDNSKSSDLEHGTRSSGQQGKDPSNENPRHGPF